MRRKTKKPRPLLLAPLLLVPLLPAAQGCGDDPAPGAEAVVLVHGLGRTPASMMVLAQRLERAGYAVTAPGYDSRSAAFAEQVAAVGDAVGECCADASRVHFVGHSLGGIVIRGLLAEARPERLGRVVLLASPNQGSRIVDLLGGIPGGADMLGPVGSALGTDSAGIPAALPPPDYEMGVIAGTRSIHPIGPLAIPGPDDGMVSVEHTRVEGVPVVVLPRSHAFIMNSRYAARAVVSFLRTGEFGDLPAPPPSNTSPTSSGEDRGPPP